MRAVIVAALLALGACSTPGAESSSPPAASPTSARNDGAHSLIGTIQVEPFAIIFRGRKNEMQFVRVWETGYRGSYTALNKCAGVVVALVRVTKDNATIWKVHPDSPVRESCVVEFFGIPGARGTGVLKIRIER
jgi:hypothetical protein